MAGPETKKKKKKKKNPVYLEHGEWDDRGK